MVLLTHFNSTNTSNAIVIITGQCPQTTIPKESNKTVSVNYGYTFHNSPMVMVCAKVSYANAACNAVTSIYQSYFMWFITNGAASSRTMNANFIAIGY